MKYLPILEELFQSDTIILLLIGFIVALLLGLKLGNKKKVCIGVGVSFFIYIVCEILSNIVYNYLASFILLFAGTFAIGSLMGCILNFIIILVKRK